MMPTSEKFRTSTDGRSLRRLEWDEVRPTVAYVNREISVHLSQVSNAVPPTIAQVLTRAVRRALPEKGGT
jgi:hypothetical protein